MFEKARDIVIFIVLVMLVINITVLIVVLLRPVRIDRIGTDVIFAVNRHEQLLVQHERDVKMLRFDIEALKQKSIK